jgi:tRNA pseudouridine32 synthase / 23S rRNA pseudouridine746 synthase
MKKMMRVPLPTIDGIGPSRITLGRGPWKTLFEFLLEHFPDVESATWISRMDKGEVADKNGVRLGPDSPCREGTTVFYYRELEYEPPVPFEESIIYRDDHILVADKPHFLPVVPSGRFLRETLLTRLKKSFTLEDLVPIHRIDRETGGIVIFSHNPATRGDYASLFQKRTVEKVYEALAPCLQGGHLPMTRRSRITRGEPFFRMKEIEGKPNSETRIDVLGTKGDITLYQLHPVTGRKHQLRLHLAALGIPILNDRLYPDVLHRGADDFSLPLKLVARSISFHDPLTGQRRYFKSSREL